MTRSHQSDAVTTTGARALKRSANLPNNLGWRRAEPLLTTLARYHAEIFSANKAPHRPKGHVHQGHADESNYLEAVITESSAVCMGDVLAKLTLMAGNNNAGAADMESSEARALSTDLDFLLPSVSGLRDHPASPSSLWHRMNEDRARVGRMVRIRSSDKSIEPIQDEVSAMEERFAKEDCCDLRDVVAKLEYLCDPNIGIGDNDSEGLLLAAAETALEFMRDFASLTHTPGLAFKEPTDYGVPD